MSRDVLNAELLRQREAELKRRAERRMVERQASLPSDRGRRALVPRIIARLSVALPGRRARNPDRIRRTSRAGSIRRTSRAGRIRRRLSN
jgi:hypothetical protein